MSDYKKEILADLKRLETNDLQDPMFLLERIKKYDFGYFYHKKGGIKERFDPDFYEYKRFIETVYSDYIELYFKEIANTEEYMLKRELAEFATRFNPKKYDILVRLMDDRVIYEDAKQALKTEVDYPVNKDALIALAQCYVIEKEQYKINSFFSRSYKEARSYALRIKEESGSGDNLNSDIYLAITQAIMLLPPEVRDELRNTVFEAYTFLSNDDRSYASNQVSGFMAIYLTLFSEPIDINILENAITVTGKHYQKNKFVLQTRYAKWLLENNQKAALEYFENGQIDENIEYIVALFADLDCKAAIPLLKEKLKTITDPIRTEVLLESIFRLENQQKAPGASERMIWLFESVSPTERALGTESDNIFVKRVQEKHRLDDTVYETDND
ncbi:hypothetical protein [uncultured Aquimarina sp.]|uniref:hypothetical protein n=1 Tax=uncultured Aquimarina sp. TaxID=575652 RepID=UPI00260F53A7|nr:hypothetical protein [uncultured Aquimarina sp.]